MWRTIKKAEGLYCKIRVPLENYIFPVILLLWPLVKVNQGVDISDSTYSLGNYIFADGVYPMWKASTYLSGLVGQLLVRMPYGNRLLFANIYTGLFVSGTALLVYYIFGRDFSRLYVFLGEVLAISFCWIPTGILYNYMSYFLFTFVGTFLYMALRLEDLRPEEEKALQKNFNRTDLYYCIAGIALGMNVMVRIPNIIEALLIVVVIVFSKKRIRAVIFCVAGFFTGLMIPFLIMIGIEGTGIIGQMISGLLNVTEADKTYSPLEMVLSVLRAYRKSSKWIGIMAAGICSGTLFFAAFNRGGAVKNIKRILYFCGIVVMLRFFWGRGMFTFRYYEDYTAIYEWGMVFLYISLMVNIMVMLGKNYTRPMKVWALLSLLIIVVTPLGSNNYTLQNMNNLFLVAPFTLYILGGWLYKGGMRVRMMGFFHGCNFPWMSMSLVVLLVIFLQSSLFHVNFVFRDGMDGTARDSYVNIESLKGMKTGTEMAKSLESVSVAITDIKEYGIDRLLLWGDCPGLTYILRLPPAIDTSWPSLESYSSAQLESALMKLVQQGIVGNTAVIIKKDTDKDYGEKELIFEDFCDALHFHTVYEDDIFNIKRVYME